MNRIRFTLALVLAVAGSLLVSAPAPASTLPSLIGVASDSGPTAGGDYVTIHGYNLTGVYVVAFGGTQTRHLHVWSSTEITVRAPAHGAGTVYVRVARPGAASRPNAYVKYTYYSADERPNAMRPTGTKHPVPPVATLTDARQALRVDLSCSYGPVCGAVGDLGVATYDGTTWSPVTATGSGPERPQISCPVDGFCMAYAADGHRWRWLSGSWTDLGALPGVVALSCQKDLICVAEAGHRAYFYHQGTWGPAEDPVPGGVSGAACSITVCMVTSPTNYYRMRSVSSFEWQLSSPMYNSSALRTSSLTQHVTGSLACAYKSYCMSLHGRPDADGIEYFAVFTGHTWSIGQRHLTSTAQPNSGSTRVVECTSRTRCLEATYRTDDFAYDYRDWTVFKGTMRTTVTQTSDTEYYNAISCGTAVPYCVGIEYDEYSDVHQD